mgnify:CR=1 FL=1
MVKKFNKPILCIVTEVGLSTNPIAKSPPYFPYYLVLDPTVTETKQIFSFGRPLEDYNLSTVDDSKIDNDIPIIFSFGFSTPGKQWDKIVELVQNDYDRAFIHFNIPRATHVPPDIENYEINKLDIKRMYRYLDKHCLSDIIDEEEDNISMTSNL